MGAEAAYLHIFIPLVREGPSRVLSDLPGSMCGRTNSMDLSYKRLLNLGGGVLTRGQVSGRSI